MARKPKQFAHLDSLEESFRERLIKILEVCASGSETLLFHAEEMLPDHWPPNVRHEATEALLKSADEIVAMRQQLGLQSAGCLAVRFRQECEQQMALDYPHRLGPRRRARQLLDEIRAGG